MPEGTGKENFLTVNTLMVQFKLEAITLCGCQLLLDSPLPVCEALIIKDN